ncbi:hypothetical protein D1816_18855 [Aquimarina sp. AD10]|uniref:Membrane-binding protein n=1 Tax=Aquimarina aggregata TaxID=1642818 RepID=A0A162ZTD2_9FLAO|nr:MULTISPECIES: hypothetical protein [Aquimarina]AXT62335.1 hypothetical protein D1816_18855 [Aquimarina sp. AD10]KZS40019.1 hypothetical protein AWE51_10285 [Aquimarina aggregata]RKM90469.1 hypothetical protein D7033_23525 [Aquimarina sp. AD10]
MKKNIFLLIFVLGTIFYSTAQSLNDVPTRHIAKLTNGWYKFKSQGAIFDVEVLNGSLSKGIVIWFDTAKYSGSFVNNKISGKGTYTWPNGDYYEGAFKNNQRHGKGTMHWADGTKYTGKWKNDKQNGKGKLFDTAGAIVKQGVWQEDLYVDNSKK